MSQEAFPDSPPSPHRQESKTTPRHVVSEDDTKDEHFLSKCFQEARRNGYDFVYHEANSEQTERKVMIIAKGIDSSIILRVLTGEEPA